MRRVAIATAVACGLGLSAGGSAQAASLLSGTWQTSCGDTCFDSHGVYSVTFSASQFSGPVDISRLGFDRAILGKMSGQFFNVSFQLGGHTLGSWGNWNMDTVAGDELFVSGQSLTWNPADGDLVLVFQLVNANGEKIGSEGGGGGGGGGSFTFSDTPDGDGGTTGGVITLGGGVVLTNNSQPLPPTEGGDNVIGDIAPGLVPEPAAWMMSISGMMAAGAALRRRRPIAQA